MKIVRNLWLLVVLVGGQLVAQGQAINSEKPDITFDLYDPEDTLGNRLFEKLVEYERFGHFGSTQSGSLEKKYMERFKALFDKGVMLPEDLTDTNAVHAKISMDAYTKLAYKRGFFPYVLFIQRENVGGYKIDTSGFYYTTVHMFKLFEDRAIIGQKCVHGAELLVGLRFNRLGDSIMIADMSVPDGGNYTQFILGKYGRHIYSPILVSNNVKTLVQDIPPPYVPKSQPTRSNFFIRAGMQYTDIFSAQPLENNLNQNYAYSSSEEGRSAGFFYQKAFAKKDIFGLTIGVEVEQNTYQLKHENANFIFDSDENGDPLMDLEGTSYDYKHVFLQSHVEDGTLNFVKPEIGLFFNLGQGWFNVQLLGSVGNAFLLESTYDARTTVSYEGEMDGVGTIQEPALGFYDNLEVTSSGTHNEVQSFMFYKGGLGLDFIIEKRLSISLLAEYKSSFTYMIRKNSAGKPFLDPDTGAGFGSQLDQLNESRNYQGVSVQAGIKIYLNEKR